MDRFLYDVVYAHESSQRRPNYEKKLSDYTLEAIRAALDGLIGKLWEKGYRYRLVNLDGEDKEGKRKTALRAEIIARKNEEWEKAAPARRKTLDAEVEAEVERLMSRKKGGPHE